MLYHFVVNQRTVSIASSYIEVEPSMVDIVRSMKDEDILIKFFRTLGSMDVRIYNRRRYFNAFAILTPADINITYY
jgi:hypothetical protein